MDVYRDLGVEPIVNAAGTLTALGGSLMRPEVTDAMAAASRAFVDMDELHQAAGRRIAELIGVEAAHVCAGSAAAISLMAAACMAGCDPERIARLPDTRSMKRRFVVQRAHRSPFDQALRLAGGEFVEVEAEGAQLAQALSGDVAAVFVTSAWFCAGPALPLPQVAELAGRAEVPVIVDAAAEVPPAENLTRFLRAGADLVAFSGGKAIRGPQSSGLILGRADLVEACRLNDNPHMAIGRPMKVGKEEIVGLVKAVELYVGQDHAAQMLVWEGRVAYILHALAGLGGVRAWRQLPRGIGQQIPHAAVSWDEQALGLTHREAARQLLAGRPRIAVLVARPGDVEDAGVSTPELRIQPHTLREGEEVVVARRLREVLAQTS